MRDPVAVAEDPCLKEQRLRDLAVRLRRTIGVARALVISGRTLDLSGVEDGVGLLCAQALDLPAERGSAMAGLLRAVLADIDALAEALRGAEAPGRGG
jgi:hypothetical protein